MKSTLLGVGCSTCWVSPLTPSFSHHYPPPPPECIVVQVVMSEREWQSSATRLGLQLMSSGARGVYQAQLPLQWAASLDLGCVVNVTQAARNRTLGEGFGLNELRVGWRCLGAID